MSLSGADGSGLSCRCSSAPVSRGEHLPRRTTLAIDYTAVHRADIDAQVAHNDDAAERAAQTAQARDDLMAS